jgi:hypothetical protein
MLLQTRKNRIQKGTDICAMNRMKINTCSFFLISPTFHLSQNVDKPGRAYNIGIDKFHQTVLIWGRFKPEIKAGLYIENKDRSFHARNFGYAKAALNRVRSDISSC